MGRTLLSDLYRDVASNVSRGYDAGWKKIPPRLFLKMTESKRVFLSAEWRDLVMLNYEVEPNLLSRYVPPGATLDSFEGRTYLSLVGFRFCRTKLLGCLPVPFHANFDEVNLRFYVRRKEGHEDRRGVVFLAELVPRYAIATTARLAYGENYKHLPMRHRIETRGLNKTLEYRMQSRRRVVHAVRSDRGPSYTASRREFRTVHYRAFLGLLEATSRRVS